jgi:hypothetical protein
MHIILNKTRKEIPEITQSDIWLELSGSKEQLENLIEEVSKSLKDEELESTQDEGCEMLKRSV